jgi:hypothetical protein
MVRARWHASENAPADPALRVLVARRGFERAFALTDGHGHRVVVGIFGTTPQAEGAQIQAGRFVAGNGHASYAPGTGIAWINYTANFAVDRRVAACALAAGHA